MKNYYQTLGLSFDATADDIKRNYKIYVQKFHPDKYNGDKFFEDRFKEIQEAYEVLSDKDKKIKYDQLISNNYTNPHLNNLHKSTSSLVIGNKGKKKKIWISIIMFFILFITIIIFNKYFLTQQSETTNLNNNVVEDTNIPEHQDIVTETNPLDNTNPLKNHQPDPSELEREKFRSLVKANFLSFAYRNFKEKSYIYDLDNNDYYLKINIKLTNNSNDDIRAIGGSIKFYDYVGTYSSSPFYTYNLKYQDILKKHGSNSIILKERNFEEGLRNFLGRKSSDVRVEISLDDLVFINGKEIDTRSEAERFEILKRAFEMNLE